MTKQMHPANAADRAKIANATHFNVHLRKGPAEKINEEAATLAEAVKIADTLKAENRKPAMIYAIMPEGTSVFVPQDMADAARQGDAPAEPEAELSNKQIAMLTAMITGGGFKRANSKEAAIARFTTVATEAGISKARAADLVKGPFDFAEHIIREHLAGRSMTIEQVQAMRGAQPVADAIAHLTEEDHAKIHDAASKVATEIVRRRDARKASLSPAEPSVPEAKKQPHRKPAGKRAEALEAAQRGELPAAPDCSAATHKPHRKKLETVIAMVKAGDIEGLKAFEIKPVSTSPRAIARYRDLAIIALEAGSHSA